MVVLKRTLALTFGEGDRALRWGLTCGCCAGFLASRWVFREERNSDVLKIVGLGWLWLAMCLPILLNDSRDLSETHQKLIPRSDQHTASTKCHSLSMNSENGTTDSDTTHILKASLLPSRNMTTQPATSARERLEIRVLLRNATSIDSKYHHGLHLMRPTRSQDQALNPLQVASNHCSQDERARCGRTESLVRVCFARGRLVVSHFISTG